MYLRSYLADFFYPLLFSLSPLPLRLSEKTLRRILKGPCKLLARSMCAMGHSHTRFIPLVVLIMSAFYLLCKARSTAACNKPAFSTINLQDGIGGFRPTCQQPLVFFAFLTLLSFSFFEHFFCICVACFSFISSWLSLI